MTDPEFTDKELAYEIGHATNVYSESFSMRFFVHDSLFRNVVNMLGNKEQQDRYNDDISNFRIFGCFAMVSGWLKRRGLRDTDQCTFRPSWATVRPCVISKQWPLMMQTQMSSSWIRPL